MSLGGTKATGLVRFLIDFFGGAEAYEEAKRQILAHPPAPEDLEDEVEVEAEKAAALAPTIKANDICLLKEAKPVFPFSSKMLSATGVLDQFISDNMPVGPSHQSSYQCLYCGCEFVGYQMDTACTHIRRKHLGVAIQCPFCVARRARWWSARPYKSHMARVHPALSEDHWYAPPLEVDVREATEACELAADRNLPFSPSPKSSTTEVSSTLP